MSETIEKFGERIGTVESCIEVHKYRLEKSEKNVDDLYGKFDAVIEKINNIRWQLALIVGGISAIQIVLNFLMRAPK